MKAFSDADKVKRFTEGSEKLPADAGYILEVKAVKYEASEEYSDMIKLMVDVVEGEHKDFFKSQFDANTSEDKKWKGTITIFCPKDDGSEKDEWTKSRFMTIMDAFEDSNKGYKWDWDESKLKGKKIGIVASVARTIIDGKAIEYTELADRGVRSVDTIKSGNFKSLKVSYKKHCENEWNALNSQTVSQQKPTAPTSDAGFMAAGEEEEIPF